MAVSRRTGSGREGLGGAVQCGCGRDMHGGSRLADRGDVICCWDDGGAAGGAQRRGCKDRGTAVVGVVNSAKVYAYGEG
ncbi:hypothetical protein SESBI_40369 [Sesbania bispinosa]|nr:hypothetical protein SESBI_40369 [Sesbania bispinosa]